MNPPIRLVSPRLDDSRPSGQAAPRLKTLDGAVLGLLANGKPNGDHLLDEIAAVLSERYAIAGVVRVAKAHPSLPPLEADVRTLADQSMAVLSAIGD